MKFFALLGLLATVSCTSSAPLSADGNWPQAAGPQGTWQVKSELEPSSDFSVRRKKDIRWTCDLPEGGQSGIVIWEKHIFLTVMKPVENVMKILSFNGILGVTIR